MSFVILRDYLQMRNAKIADKVPNFLMQWNNVS